MSFWESFFLLLIWIPLALAWAAAVFDVFRRDDLRGSTKALWLLAILLLPLFGTLIYLITRPVGVTPAERAELDQASRQFVERYTPTTTAQELALLADLRDRGTLDEQEFLAEKQRILGAGQDGSRPAEASR